MHAEVTQRTVNFHFYGVNNGGGTSSGFSSDRFRALLGIKVMMLGDQFFKKQKAQKKMFNDHLIFVNFKRKSVHVIPWS